MAEQKSFAHRALTVELSGNINSRGFRHHSKRLVKRSVGFETLILDLSLIQTLKATGIKNILQLQQALAQHSVTLAFKTIPTSVLVTLKIARLVPRLDQQPSYQEKEAPSGESNLFVTQDNALNG